MEPIILRAIILIIGMAGLIYFFYKAFKTNEAKYTVVANLIWFIALIIDYLLST